jgi:hypothetical protein
MAILLGCGREDRPDRAPAGMDAKDDRAEFLIRSFLSSVGEGGGSPRTHRPMIAGGMEALGPRGVGFTIAYAPQVRSSFQRAALVHGLRPRAEPAAKHLTALRSEWPAEGVEALQRIVSDLEWWAQRAKTGIDATDEDAERAVKFALVRHRGRFSSCRNSGRPGVAPPVPPEGKSGRRTSAVENDSQVAGIPANQRRWVDGEKEGQPRLRTSGQRPTTRRTSGSVSRARAAA